MELRKLSDLFWKVSPNLFFFSTLLGVVSGICYAAIIPFVIFVLGSDIFDFYALHDKGQSIFDSPTSELAFVFLGFCCVIVVINYFSELLSAFINQKASLEHRKFIFKRIQEMPYAELEKMGQAKLLNLIKMDVPAVTTAAISYPKLWVNTVTVIGISAYLLYLDSRVFMFVALIVLITLVLFRIPLFFGTRFIEESRNLNDNIQENVNGLIYGSKELKLNRKRATEFHEEELYHTELNSRKAQMKGRGLVLLGDYVGELAVYITMALVIFHFPYVYQVTQNELIGIVFALVYLAAPIGIIMDAFSSIKVGGVSLGKLQKFYERTRILNNEEPQETKQNWTCYKIRNLGYKYSESNETFALKPISLTFQRKQVTFITGGNGSGKSTLSKCLTLHYAPTEGELLFDSEVITSAKLESARQNISAIYSDYFLFKRLMGEEGQVDISKVNKYLAYLELQDKVKIVDGRFNTTSLSDGQKKRLALLVLLLEDRDICIFDEWASDQDPRFKHIFYTCILPELKAANKIVIVITHDDRYFHLADQLVEMEYGTLKNVVNKSNDYSVEKNVLLNNSSADELSIN